MTFSSLLARWRQRRLARFVQRACGLGLPDWAVSEVTFSAPQAAWLHRNLCLWHLQAGADRALSQAAAPAPVRLSALCAGLARYGIALQACRMADPRALQRGDVVVLSDAAARRLFGEAAIGSGGLVQVLEAGRPNLRLRPALSPRPLSCPADKLQGALAGWVLRSHVVAEPVARRTWRWATA